MIFAQAEVKPGSWKLRDNEIWSIPNDVGEQRFEMKHHGPWNVIVSIRALAITLDGKVFGMRRMSRPKESGYQMEGRVNIGHRKYRAFTSSKLFERPDGSLVDVAVFIVRGI